MVDLAPGIAVVALNDLYEPWPTASGRDAGARMRSRTNNEDGSITFRYSVGDLSVEETIAPTAVSFSMGREDTAVERLGIERRFVVRAPQSGVGRSVVARVALANRFDRVGQGRWRLDGEQWPLIEIDGESARSARVLEPKRATEPLFGADEDSRPAVDGREREASREGSARAAAPTPDELRIPVLLAPSGDGTKTLVGTFSWRLAW